MTGLRQQLRDNLVALAEKSELSKYWDEGRSNASRVKGWIYKKLGRSEMSEAVAQRGGKSKRVYTVTPSGLRTARDLHRVRERIWNTIAEGRQS